MSCDHFVLSSARSEPFPASTCAPATPAARDACDARDARASTQGPSPVWEKRSRADRGVARISLPLRTASLRPYHTHRSSRNFRYLLKAWHPQSRLREAAHRKLVAAGTSTGMRVYPHVCHDSSDREFMAWVREAAGLPGVNSTAVFCTALSGRRDVHVWSVMFNHEFACVFDSEHHIDHHAAPIENIAAAMGRSTHRWVLWLAHDRVNLYGTCGLQAYYLPYVMMTMTDAKKIVAVYQQPLDVLERHYVGFWNEVRDDAHAALDASEAEGGAEAGGEAEAEAEAIRPPSASLMGQTGRSRGAWGST